jgi:hypothetical protein
LGKSNHATKNRANIADATCTIFLKKDFLSVKKHNNIIRRTRGIVEILDNNDSENSNPAIKPENLLPE